MPRSGLFHFGSKGFRGLKGRDRMGRNDHRRIFGDVTRRFGCPVFQQERAEPSQVNILTADQGVPELLHESFHYTRYDSFLNAGLLRDPAYDVRLCHILIVYRFIMIHSGRSSGRRGAAEIPRSTSCERRLLRMLPRPPPPRPHRPVPPVHFAIIPISSAKIIFFPPVCNAMSVPCANGCHADADGRHSGNAPSSAARVVLNSPTNHSITMRICHRRTI